MSTPELVWRRRLIGATSGLSAVTVGPVIGGVGMVIAVAPLRG
jgi:hypothetical protein